MASVAERRFTGEDKGPALEGQFEQQRHVQNGLEVGAEPVASQELAVPADCREVGPHAGAEPGGKRFADEDAVAVRSGPEQLLDEIAGPATGVAALIDDQNGRMHGGGIGVPVHGLVHPLDVVGFHEVVASHDDEVAA